MPVSETDTAISYFRGFYVVLDVFEAASDMDQLRQNLVLLSINSADGEP